MNLLSTNLSTSGRDYQKNKKSNIFFLFCSNIVKDFFASMVMKKYCGIVLYFVMSLSDFGIRVILPS